jgi:hypothetical protein
LLDVEDFGRTPVIHRLIAGKRTGGSHRHATNDEAGNQ